MNKKYPYHPTWWNDMKSIFKDYEGILMMIFLIVAVTIVHVCWVLDDLTGKPREK